jgi:hypothetical protein
MVTLLSVAEENGGHFELRSPDAGKLA